VGIEAEILSFRTRTKRLWSIKRRIPREPVYCGGTYGEKVRRDLFCPAASLRVPLGAECGAVDFLSPQVNLVDSPRVGNILQRIRVEDDEIGALARRHRPGIDPRDFGRIVRHRAE